MLADDTLSRPKQESVPGEPNRPPWRSVFLICVVAAAIWVTVIVSVHRVSPRTLVSAHGLLHSAIAQRFVIADSFAVPPENPLFGGEAVPYYWFFHWLGAGVSQVVGLDPLRAFELLILLGVVGLVVASGLLARVLFASVPAGFMISFFMLAGASPQAPAVLAREYWKWGDAVFKDNGNYLWGLAHPVAHHMRSEDPYSLYGPLLNFFFNISSRPLALAVLPWIVLSLFGLLRNPTKRSWWGLAASVALCTAFSPIVGLTVVGCLGVSVALGWGFRRWVRPGHVPRIPAARLAIIAASMATGVLLAFLTFHHLLGGEGGEIQFLDRGFEGVMARLRTMLGAGWLLILLAAYGVVRAPPTSRGFLGIVMFAGIAAMSGTALLTPPVGNECNFFHVTLVLLSIPAAAVVLPRVNAVNPHRTQRLRATVLAAMFLPTTSLVIFSYWDRPAVALAFDGEALKRKPTVSALSQMYEWVEASTETDALFVIEVDRLRTVMGNVSEFPAFTRRVLFMGSTKHYLVEPNEDVLRRYLIVRALQDGYALSGINAEYLKKLGRPLYLVTEKAEDEGLLRRLKGMHGEPVFREEGVAVFRVSSEVAVAR